MPPAMETEFGRQARDLVATRMDEQVRPRLLEVPQRVAPVGLALAARVPNLRVRAAPVRCDGQPRRVVLVHPGL